jgi:hypothetical protein
MAKLEFQNNGIVDSLTRAPAPSIFYSILEREIALKIRGEFEISIVTLKLNGISDDRQLLIGHSGLTQTLRKGDFYSRIAHTGFWILTRTEQAQAEIAAQRFCDSMKKAIAQDRKNYSSLSDGGVKGFGIKYQIFQHQKEESFLTFLDRVDSDYF